MSRSPIKVLLVEPSWYWREALLRILEQQEQFEILAAVDVDSARQQLRGSHADVVIIDVDECSALLPELQSRDIPCVALSRDVNRQNLVTALRAGASFLLKPELEPTRLCEVLLLIHSGDVLLAQATRRMLSSLLEQPPTATQRYGLTRRESEALALIAEGCTNAEIAQALHLATSSVKKLVSRTLRRLGVETRTQAALLFHLEGLHASGSGPACDR